MGCEFYHQDRNGLCLNRIEGSPGDPPDLCRRESQFHCTEDLKKHLPRMSHSSRIDFCRCRQLYFFRKIHGLQIKKSMLAGHQSHISYAERGYPFLSEHQKKKIAELLGISVCELFPEGKGGSSG